MAMPKAKRAVTRFFAGRKAALRTLSMRGINSHSDFFELYVLVRIAKLFGGALVTSQQTPSGKRIFAVATSPSPSWSKASYLRIGDLGARTGLEVQCSPGTVELDVVFVDLQSLVPGSDEVPAQAAVATLECKALKRPVTASSANEMLGKAFRVWTLPVPRVQKAGEVAPRYSAVALAGCTDGAQAALDAQNIGVTDTPAGIGQILRRLRVVLTP